jgi:energy-coupling factor transporter transmembrane protein EcfT
VDVGRSRTWGARNTVIAVGTVAALLFILIDLTGSDIDTRASQVGGIALEMLLFTVFGLAGVALAYWEPRFALLGTATATLALLAFGATAVLTWDRGSFLFGLGVGGDAATVAGITDLLAIATSAICVLLATVRTDEDGGTRLVRVAAISSLVLLVALAILQILDHDVDIGPRVYAILATAYVAATAILLILRALPLAEDQ